MELVERGERDRKKRWGGECSFCTYYFPIFHSSLLPTLFYNFTVYNSALTFRCWLSDPAKTQ